MLVDYLLYFSAVFYDISVLFNKSKGFNNYLYSYR